MEHFRCEDHAIDVESLEMNLLAITNNEVGQHHIIIK